MKYQQIHSNRAKQVGSHRRRHFFEPCHRLGPHQRDNRESNNIYRWIREAKHIRKEQDKSMNWVEGSY